MLRIPLPWLTLIVATLLFFVLREKSPTELLSPTINEEVVRFPHAYMIDIDTEDFDQDGKLISRMSTPAAQHFQINPDAPGPEDHTIFTQPKMFFFSERDATPWRLSAAEGHSDANGNVITLTNNVRIEQQDADSSSFLVTTSLLTIRPLDQFAETDKAVKMRAPQGVVETIGMQAWLNEDRIELLSKVRGTYAP